VSVAEFVEQRWRKRRAPISRASVRPGDLEGHAIYATKGVKALEDCFDRA
jgi:hypothetical protein